MYLPGSHEMVQTVRGVAGPAGPALVAEGTNLRYGAIVALGLALTDEATQSDVLAGETVADLVGHLRSQAVGHTDPGAVALTCWAAAEVCGVTDSMLFGRLQGWLDDATPLPVVDLSWMLTAAVAALSRGTDGKVGAIRDEVARRLLAAQGEAGIFPHVHPASVQTRLRRHVGCFADQVYPIQALARLATATGRRDALAAANRCAARICDAAGSRWSVVVALRRPGWGGRRGIPRLQRPPARDGPDGAVRPGCRRRRRPLARGAARAASG